MTLNPSFASDELNENGTDRAPTKYFAMDDRMKSKYYDFRCFAVVLLSDWVRICGEHNECLLCRHRGNVVFAVRERPSYQRVLFRFIRPIALDPFSLPIHCAALSLYALSFCFRSYQIIASFNCALIRFSTGNSSKWDLSKPVPGLCSFLSSPLDYV